MARRWVRYQLPVMVCVEVSETEEHEQVTKVVLGVEHDDLQLDRDTDRRELVYDERMERVSPDEDHARQALAAGDPSQWPARRDWEEGPDALRDRWLYEDGDVVEDLEDDLGPGAGDSGATGAGDPSRPTQGR